MGLQRNAIKQLDWMAGTIYIQHFFGILIFTLLVTLFNVVYLFFLFLLPPPPLCIFRKIKRSLLLSGEQASGILTLGKYLYFLFPYKFIHESCLLHPFDFKKYFCSFYTEKIIIKNYGESADKLFR